jgi:hypothetical protein
MTFAIGPSLPRFASEEATPWAPINPASAGPLQSAPPCSPGRRIPCSSNRTAAAFSWVLPRPQAPWPLLTPYIARAAAMRRTVRIATVNPPASATGQACRAFAEAAAKSPVLSAILQVDVVAGGTAGGELEMTQACIKGTLDLAVPASNVVGSLVPELGLLDAPFLFRDADHARGVLDSDIGAEFTALMKPKGSKRSRPSAPSAVLSNRWPASWAGSPPRSNNSDPPRRRSRAVCRRRPPGLRRSAGISRA